MPERKQFLAAPAVVTVMLAMIELSVQPARAVTHLPGEQPEHAVVRMSDLNAGNLGGALQILRSPLPQNTRIHVVSVRHTPGSRTTMVRLACDAPGECLPFYAIVQGFDLPLFGRSASAAAVSHEPVAKPPLRAGDRVQIVEELSGMNLRAAGVCLQPGSVGDRIRVRTLATHRVLVATIAAPNLVKVER